MINSQIKVVKSGITYDLDFFDDQPINLNFSVNDIRDISKRNSTYSKTITIPATKNNNIIFDNLQDINVSTLVDQVYLNKSLEAYFYYNSILIRSGSIKVQKVNIVFDYPTSYDITFLSESATFSNVLSDSKIFLNDDTTKNIDVSDLDHTFGMDRIIACWWQTGQSFRYEYPLIDYIGNTDGNNVFEMKNIHPAIYVKELWDRIFLKAGFTYESTFLNTDHFKNLVCPWTGKFVHDTTWLNTQKLVDVDYTTNVALLTANNFKYLAFNNIISDIDNQYNVTTGKIFTDKTGSYDLEATITVGQVSYPTERHYYLTLFIGPVGNLSFYDIFIKVPANTVYKDTIYLNKAAVNINAGDQVYLRVSKTSASGPNFVIYSGSSFSMTPVEIDNQIYEGEELQMNMLFGDKVPKQIEFVKDIITMFNLIVDEDPLRQKHLIIEPTDLYYSGGTFVDWSSKVDVSDCEITRLPEFIDKSVYLTMKEDDDSMNNKFKTNTNKIYGQKYQYNDIKSEDLITIKTVSSPTPLGYYGETEIVLSKIYGEVDGKGTPSLNDDDVEQRAFNPRILYYKNIPIEGDKSFVIHSPFQGWNYLLSSGASINWQPYAGHLDNPYFDVYDYEFGNNEYYYFTINGNAVTYQNLWYMYYRNYLNGLMDHDTKLIKYQIKLNELDINNFSFKNTVRIANSSYIVNKIVDWNPNELCTIELLKLSSNYLAVKSPYRIAVGRGKENKPIHHINIVKPNEQVGIFYDASGNTISDWDEESYRGALLQDNRKSNKFSNKSNLILIGINNHLGTVMNTMIIGDSNELLDNNENINIIGSRNKII